MKPVATKYVSLDYIIYHIYEWDEDYQAIFDPSDYPDKWYVYCRVKFGLVGGVDPRVFTLEKAFDYVARMEG